MDIKDLKGLMEAYNTIYVPQELTEEQVWEEVENWVNSLLEEGYDLSEYTWEEMYEVYLSEATDPKKDVGARMGTAIVDTVTDVVTGTGKDIRNLVTTGKLQDTPERQRIRQGVSNFSTSAKNVLGIKAPTSTVAKPAVKPTPVAPTGSTVQKSAPGPVLSKKDGVEGTGVGANFKARAFTAAEKSRYAAQNTAKPTPKTSRASSPATASTAEKIKGGLDVYKQQVKSGDVKGAEETGKATWALANPKLAASNAERERTRGTSSTTNPLMKDMKSRLPAAAPKVDTSTTLGQTTAAALKPTAFNPSSSSSSTAAAKPTPTPNLQKSIRANRLNMSFDLFDVVMGHLLDEGYADTEEAALAIMANMSEEWRQSIVEQQVPIHPAEDAFNKSTPEDRAANMKKYNTPYKPLDTSRSNGTGGAPAWMRGGFKSPDEYNKLDPKTKAMLD